MRRTKDTLAPTSNLKTFEIRDIEMFRYCIIPFIKNWIVVYNAIPGI